MQPNKTSHPGLSLKMFIILIMARLPFMIFNKGGQIILRVVLAIGNTN